MFEQENTFESDRIGMIYVAIISADAGHTDRLMAGLRARKKRNKTSCTVFGPISFLKIIMLVAANRALP